MRAAEEIAPCINVRQGPAAGNNYKPWRNNGVLVGSPVVTAPNVDSALLQGSGQTYSPTVYLGGPTSTETRVVVSSAASDLIGEPVAVNGAESGQVLSHVLAFNIYTGSLTVTVMADAVTLGGDSGAPWLQTNSNGTVIAKGQHVGLYDFNGAPRSIYMPTIRISAALSASILTN